MRTGTIYRRCGACGRRFFTRERRCPGCSSEHFSWGYAIDLARPGSNKRRHVFKAGFATRAGAQLALDDLVISQRRGVSVEPSRITVGDYLKGWVRTWSVREGTQISYESYIRHQVSPRLGALPLQSLTTREIRAFYRELAGNGNAKTKGPLSAKSVLNIHRMLHVALNAAVMDGLLAANPAYRAFDRPSDVHGSEADLVWSPDQLHRFLAFVAERTDAALWRLVAMTGMRRGEALGLTWEKIADGKVTVTTQRRRGRHGPALGDPKTRSGRRYIALDAETARVLELHRASQAGRLALMDASQTDETPVFDRGDGAPLHPDVVSQRFARLVRESHLPRIPLKNLRHTHATIALKAGVHPKVVQQRLGHSSIMVTMDVYSFALPGMDEDAVDKIAGLVDRSSEPGQLGPPLSGPRL